MGDSGGVGSIAETERLKNERGGERSEIKRSEGQRSDGERSDGERIEERWARTMRQRAPPNCVFTTLKKTITADMCFVNN